jgi:hypothetical protein
MQKLIYSLLAFGSVCGAVGLASSGAATVRTIDDSTLNGDLLSIRDGKLTVAVTPSANASTQPTTPPATQPTTQPAGVSTTNPTTQPTSLAMSEVVQVFLRDPPQKARRNAAPPPASEVAGEGNPTRRSSGLFSAIFHIFSSSSESPADATETDQTTVKVQAAAPASQPATTQPAMSKVEQPSTTQTATVLPATTQAATTQPIATGSPSSQPSVAPTWKVTMVTGDVLHGRIEKWSGKTLSLRLDVADAPAMDLPTDQIAEFWCGDAAAQEKARAIVIAPGPEDVVFVKKDAEVVTVKGLALGIEGEALRFRYDEQDRKIGLGKLVGIIPGAAGRSNQPPHFHQTIKLDSGDELSGKWTGVTADALTVKTDWGVELKLPLKSVCTIDFIDGRMVYLSDLTPLKVEQTPFFGRVVPWRVDESLTGGPLQLSDGTYARGIAVHSRCVLDYDLAGAFQQFRTKIGFEQPAGKRGHAAVRVLGDGKALYENLDARGDQAPAEINLNISGVKRLTLEVDFGDHTDAGGRVIWANARLFRAEAPQ